MQIGPYGSGYLVKLMANSLWFSQAVAVPKTPTLAQRAGLIWTSFAMRSGRAAAASRFMADHAGALLDGDDRATFSLLRTFLHRTSATA